MKGLLVASLLFLISSSAVTAAGFQLKNIGSLDTKGVSYSEWWYSTENPTLSGTTAAGDSVTVTIGGQAGSATVDSSGNWSYTPTNLTVGDHQVSVAGGAGSTAFILHITANIPSNVSAPSQSDMPVAGVIENTLVLWLVGGLLLIAGIFVVPNKNSS